MLFVALLKSRPGTAQDRIARRMAFQYPPGVGEVVAEYWLQTSDPAVVLIFKADHIGQMWAAFAGWEDFFEITIYPATTAQEGLELLKQMMPPQ
jgi:hypothetical protein